jgi:hypothetical protein
MLAETVNTDSAHLLFDSWCAYVTYHCGNTVGIMSPALQDIINILETAVGKSLKGVFGGSKGKDKETEPTGVEMKDVDEDQRVTKNETSGEDKKKKERKEK